MDRIEKFPQYRAEVYHRNATVVVVLSDVYDAF